MSEVRDREKIIDRIKSMIIRCMYCDYPNPISLSAIEYETKATGSHASAFLICPECRNKFMMKIQDLGAYPNSGSVTKTIWISIMKPTVICHWVHKWESQFCFDTSCQ